MFAFLVITAMVLTILVRGWAMTVLWGWFIVPVFIGAPHLTIPAALGLSTFVGMFTSHLANKATIQGPDRNVAVAEALGSSVMITMLSVGIGWIINQFM